MKLVLFSNVQYAWASTWKWQIKHMLVIVDSRGMNIKVGMNVPSSLECNLGQSMLGHPRSLDQASPSKKKKINKKIKRLKKKHMWATYFHFREEDYGRWNGLPVSREARSLIINWRVAIIHDQIDRPPILYLLSFIFRLVFILRII